jgi:hypothetical protein
MIPISLGLIRMRRSLIFIPLQRIRLTSAATNGWFVIDEAIIIEPPQDFSGFQLAAL